MFSKKEPEPVLNADVIMIGAMQTGKTALAIRYANGRFNEAEHGANPTGAMYSRYPSVGKRRLGLRVWDTSGDPIYRRLVTLHLGLANAVMVCFSLVDRSSFESLEDLLKIPRKECRPDTYIMLVGTMCEFKEDGGWHKQRVVGYDEAEAFAKSQGLPYVEVSAKENINVNEAFGILKEEMARKLYGEEMPEKCSCSCSMF